MGVLVLMLLAGLKILATSTTLAAGGSGGVFAPALYIGAMAGGAFGLLANAVFPTVTAPAGAYALVGMGAVFGAAAHAPMSAVLILFEMTDDYQIILPLMLAVVISHLLASRLHPDSIYSAKLRHLGGTLPLPLGRGSVLDLVRVIDAMTDHPELLRRDTPILEVATRFRDTNQRGFTVVDAKGSVIGIVTATDVQSALVGGESNHLVAADIMTSNPICCTPDESLREVLQRISDQDISQVPVVDKEDPRRVVGLLRREQILWAIGEMASEHSRLLDEASPDRGENLVRLHVQIRREHRDACFKHVRELDIPPPCLVTEVRRAERSVVPKGDTLIEPGDVLAIVTARANESRVREWIARLDRRVADTVAGP
jgi:CIC family chloride channel protein